jgi:hypothetical protein
MGKNGMQTAPAMTMNSDVTVENTGRLMKKSANKAKASSSWKSRATAGS